MPSFRGLYYPYIHFQDEGWLKSAALYWDEIDRIVPYGTNRSDSDEVKRLSDSGFIRNQPPKAAARKIADPFLAFLASHGENLQRKLASVPAAEKQPYAIFDEKMDMHLIRQLIDLGLATRRHSWIMMHSQLANIYMTALAEAMAPGIGARPIADDPREHVAISGLTMERLSDLLLGGERDSTRVRQDQELEGAMATIAVRCVVPADPSKISADQIIKFRKDYEEERGQFQSEINKIIKSLDHISEMDDEAAIIRDLESAYKKNVAGKLDRLERGMRRSNWDVIENALASSWPIPAALTAAFGAFGLVVPAAAAGAASVALGGWSILRRRQKAVDDALKPSAEAYLYQAKKALSPQSLVENVYARSQTIALPA